MAAIGWGEVEALRRAAARAFQPEQLAAAEPMENALARRRKEEAAQLLTLVARHAPRLARTYCRPLLEALLPLLRATPHASTAAARAEMTPSRSRARVRG